MKATLIQLGTVMLLSMLSFMLAFTNAWPSYAIGILKSAQSPLGYKITDSEANIISSIPFLASMPAALCAGNISEALGRKRTQILSALIYIVAWSLIVTAKVTIQIVLGRFILGFSSGLAIVSVLIFAGEITQLSNKGSGATAISLVYNIGGLCSYLEGWFLSYEMICYISITIMTVTVVLMSLLKESPSWLIRSGREEEALKSLMFYRGESKTTDAILEELNTLKSHANIVNQDVEKPILEKNGPSKEKESRFKAKSRSPWIEIVAMDYNRRALLSSIMFMMSSVSTGMIAVQTYANQFFSKAAPTLSPDLCSVLLAVLLIITSFVTIFVTDLVSRRAMMISTCSISTVCLISLGASLRWPWVPGWVAPAAIITFCFVYQLGVVNVVFIQLAECFGPKVNSVASAIIICVMFASNFIVVYAFGPSVSYFGIDGTFFIFAGLCAMTTILSVFFMKETRRVPLEDVQRMFSKGYLYRRL